MRISTPPPASGAPVPASGNRRIPKAVAPEVRAKGRTPAPRAPSPRARRVFDLLRALVGGALVVTLSATVAWAVRRHIVRSPSFAVTDIVLTGQRQRTADQLLEEAGLAKGVNIFTVDLDRAKARLLADPWVSEAALGRRLPSTLVVQVTEREIGALVSLRQLYLCSRDGALFKRFELGDPTDLPLITGLDPDVVADDREGTRAVVRRALDLASDYERSTLGPRSPIEEIHVTPDGGFTLMVGARSAGSSAKEVVALLLGGPPFRKKLEEAAKVTAELDRRGSRAEAIMLDDEARPERVVARTR